MNKKNNRGNLLVELLLKALLVIVFIFILVWLFPTKNSLNPLYQEVFRNNINSMKDAAETYFTNERLPKEVGESVRLTLREMLDKDLLLPFVDKYNKSCSLDASYVEITKTETEYELKVNLVCSKEQAFITEHLGCTDKCLVDCNKEQTKKVTEYQFSRQTNTKQVTGYSCNKGYTLNGKTCVKDITTTDKKDATAVYKNQEVLVNANKKEEKVTKYLYKYEKEIITTDTTKPIRHYTYDNVIGYAEKTVCDSYNYFIDSKTSTLYQNADWTLVNTITVKDIPEDTTTTKYVVKGMDFDKCMETCTLNPYYKVEVYKRNAKVVTKTSEELSVTCNTVKKQVPMYGLKITFAGFAQNKEIKTEWASTSNDQKLINDGYKYVSIRKEDGTTTKTTYTCPSSTKQSPSDETKCIKEEKVLSGYKCDLKDYKLDGKYCTKKITKTEKVNATPKYKTVQGLEYTWSTSKTLKGWTATGKTRTVNK